MNLCLFYNLNGFMFNIGQIKFKCTNIFNNFLHVNNMKILKICDPDIVNGQKKLAFALTLSLGSRSFHFDIITHVPAYLLPEELLLLSGLGRRRRRRHVAAQRLRPEALVRPLRPRRRRHGRGTPEGRVEGARRPRTADRLLAESFAHLETRTGGTLRSRTV